MHNFWQTVSGLNHKVKSFSLNTYYVWPNCAYKRKVDIRYTFLDEYGDLVVEKITCIKQLASA